MMGKRILFIRYCAGSIGEFVIGIYELDVPRLIALFDRLVQRAPALRNQHAAAIPLIQRDAMRTADVLRQAIFSV